MPRRADAVRVRRDHPFTVLHPKRKIKELSVFILFFKIYSFGEFENFDYNRGHMKYRALPNTPVKVSEIGFGMWTVSTGWWGKYTETEAIQLMEEGLNLGITTFDAADTYGNGYSEELIGKAFSKKRDQIQIATKVGYDFYSHGEERKGQSEIPHNFSVPFIREAVEKALQRLKTDRIDVLQLHNIRMEQVEDDSLWTLMEDLRTEGKILAHGAALGPADRGSADLVGGGGGRRVRQDRPAKGRHRGVPGAPAHVGAGGGARLLPGPHRDLFARAW